MRPRLTSIFLAIVLVSSALAQEQQPSKDQAPPDSNTPQTSAPQAANPQTPSANDTQNAAPPSNQSEQAAPKPDEPTNPNSPGTQEKAPLQQQPQPAGQPAAQSKAPAKPKAASHKTTQSRKRKATTSAKSKSPHRPKATSPSSPGDPRKVVVRNGGATDDVIHLSPGGTQEQNAHNRETTEQLLATTDENLKRISGRQLSPAEQSTVDQIHSYMRQAKSAADSGDLARAHTLAFKAHLLSDDLAQH